MTKLVIVYKATADLIPYAQNSRTHSAAQVNQIDASIERFGFTNPILIDETGGVIAGHGRLLAANQRGMPEVPTITLSGLTETQRRAYVIADNRIALNSGWDYKLLASELAAVQSAGGAVDNLGFSDSEILCLIGDLDRLPPPPPASDTAPDSRPGKEKRPGENGFKYEQKYALIVSASSEENQSELYTQLTGYGLDVKVVCV